MKLTWKTGSSVCKYDDVYITGLFGVTDDDDYTITSTALGSGHRFLTFTPLVFQLGDIIVEKIYA